LIDAQKNASDSQEEVASVYYLLAVIDAEVNQEKAQNYLRHAQALAAESSTYFSPSIKDAIATLIKQKQAQDPVTIAINEAENNVYNNPHMLPDYEQQYSEGLQFLLIFPEISQEPKTASEKTEPAKKDEKE
jgi:hypothetical protein